MNSSQVAKLMDYLLPCGQEPSAPQLTVCGELPVHTHRTTADPLEVAEVNDSRKSGSSNSREEISETTLSVPTL